MNSHQNRLEDVRVYRRIPIVYIDHDFRERTAEMNSLPGLLGEVFERARIFEDIFDRTAGCVQFAIQLWTEYANSLFVFSVLYWSKVQQESWKQKHSVRS